MKNQDLKIEFEWLTEKDRVELGYEPTTLAKYVQGLKKSSDLFPTFIPFGRVKIYINGKLQQMESDKYKATFITDIPSLCNRFGPELSELKHQKELIIESLENPPAIKITNLNGKVKIELIRSMLNEKIPAVVVSKLHLYRECLKNVNKCIRDILAIEPTVKDTGPLQYLEKSRNIIKELIRDEVKS